MPYLYLVIAVLCSASGCILCAFYNRKNQDEQDASIFYTILLLISNFACWLTLFLVDGGFSWAVLPYALLFAAGYIVCNFVFIKALKIGSVALTSLILQLSLIGTTVWGFCFWDTKFTLVVGIALALVVAALGLCLYPGKSEKQPFNVTWLVLVLIIFLSNACCLIVQKTQQIKFDGEYGNCMMMLATGISALTAVGIFLKEDKIKAKRVLKGSWYFPVLAGGLNAVLNLFVILLATTPLSPSLIYPVLSIGGLMITILVSAFIFKEKMRWWQWIGIAVGIVAIGLLS